MSSSASSTYGEARSDLGTSTRAQGRDRNGRTRRSAPRSRAGCSTCKIRHVKCDEKKPICARCADAGIKCDGYTSSTSHNQRHTQHVAAPSCAVSNTTSSLPLEITAYAIPFRIPGSQKDRKLLHYFCVQASHDLSGFVDSDFWSKVVLQYSYAEPTVRDALVALSSIHLDFVTCESSDRPQKHEDGRNVETLLHYNRAVRRLRRYLSSNVQPSTKVALICCALFYCFDSVRGDYDGAKKHLRSGLEIIQITRENITKDRPSCDSSETKDDLEKLQQIFSRLDVQATIFDDTRTPVLELTSAAERGGVTPVVRDPVFKDLVEAQLTLDKLQNELLNFLTRNNRCKFFPADDLPDFIVQEKRELKKQFRRWLVALDEFLKVQIQSDAVKRTLGDLGHNIKTHKSTTALKLHHRLAQMFLFASFPEDNSIFGASPNPDAQCILEWAETLIQSKHKHSPNTTSIPPTPSRSFSSEMGVLAPLFLLAMKCRDAHVCEKAVSLLAASNRREGLIDAQMVLSIVERVAVLKQQEDLTPLVVEAAKRSPAACVEDMPLEVWGAEAIERTKDGLQGIAEMLHVQR